MLGEHDDARGAVGDDPVAQAQALARATSTQVGALGEETAVVLLEMVWGGTIVAMGKLNAESTVVEHVSRVTP